MVITVQRYFVSCLLNHSDYPYAVTQDRQNKRK